MRVKPVEAFYLLAMIVVVVLVDVLFFRHQFAERLITNVAIVVVFLVFYVTVLKRR